MTDRLLILADTHLSKAAKLPTMEIRLSAACLIGDEYFWGQQFVSKQWLHDHGMYAVCVVAEKDGRPVMKELNDIPTPSELLEMEV